MVSASERTKNWAMSGPAGELTDALAGFIVEGKGGKRERERGRVKKREEEGIKGGQKGKAGRK